MLRALQLSRNFELRIGPESVGPVLSRDNQRIRDRESNDPCRHDP